jgi:hypothetical protein
MLVAHINAAVVPDRDSPMELRLSHGDRAERAGRFEAFSTNGLGGLAALPRSERDCQ